MHPAIAQAYVHLEKALGRATGWKAGWYGHVQISELFSMVICDQPVMDFLAVTEVGSSPGAE